MCYCVVLAQLGQYHQTLLLISCMTTSLLKLDSISILLSRGKLCCVLTCNSVCQIAVCFDALFRYVLIPVYLKLTLKNCCTVCYYFI